MENRKPSRKPVDDLALTKSAAWAWHQRGSEFHGKPINEFHGWRNKVDQPKPSRYKIEAMRRKGEAETSYSNSPPKLSSLRSFSVSSSLLDEYDIKRIFREFEYYSKSARAKHGSGARPYSGDQKAEEEEVTAMEMKSKSRVKKNKSKWIWPRDDVTCGSSINDVVKSTSFEYSLQSGTKKGHVVVVKDVGCRYRFQGLRTVVAKDVGRRHNVQGRIQKF